MYETLKKYIVTVEEATTYYFKAGYTYSSIILFLKLYRNVNINISVGTLGKRKLRGYNMKRKSRYIDKNVFKGFI